MIDTGVGYAVVLATQGTTPYRNFFAMTVTGQAAIFSRRAKAFAFRDELREHGLGKGRVVKVRWTVEAAS